MKNTIHLMILCALLSACGAEIAYKRGATARDFQLGKQACASAPNEAALTACLEEKGWAVQKLDNIGISDEELFATASYDADNRQEKPKKGLMTTEDIAAANMPTKDIPTETTEKTIAEPAKIPSKNTANHERIKQAKLKTKPQTAEPSKTSNSPKTEVKKPNKALKDKETIKEPSLLDTYVIKSWWKMGGNLSLLENHMDGCKTQLGEAHYPNKKTFTFTRGFAICMRQHGWRGLVEKH